MAFSSANPFALLDDTTKQEASPDVKPRWSKGRRAFALMEKKKNFRTGKGEDLRREAFRILPHLLPEEGRRAMAFPAWLQRAPHVLFRAKHYWDRLKDYRGNHYEMTKEEERTLRNAQLMQAHVRTSAQQRLVLLVELGLNKHQQVCKFGIVLPAPGNNDGLHPTKTPGRVLFLCLGIDRNIKTWYINNGYKARPTGYKARDGIPTLSQEATEQLFATKSGN